MHTLNFKIFTFIRILLLSSWGMTEIRWENPAVGPKLAGIWIEFIALTGLLAISVTMMMVTCKVSTYNHGCKSQT